MTLSLPSSPPHTIRNALVASSVPLLSLLFLSFSHLLAKRVPLFAVVVIARVAMRLHVVVALSRHVYYDLDFSQTRHSFVTSHPLHVSPSCLPACLAFDPQVDLL